LAAQALGLYVHFPFCLSKCAYCDFPSQVTERIPDPAYRDAVVEEIRTRAPEFGSGRFSTIFFGGGTPSLWSPDSVAAVIDAARTTLGLAPDTEISLEANPGTIDTERLAAYRDAGVNRLSLGIQSLDDRLLSAVGRIHDRGQALRAVAAARDAGLDNLGLDLIFGLPGQVPEAWVVDLGRALTLAPEHLSLYQLTLAEGTPLRQAVDRGVRRVPDEDATAQMLEQGLALAADAGYLRYEVSNLSRPDRRCRHNLIYWTGGEYLGVGAAAASFRRVGIGLGERVTNSSDPQAYLCDRPGTAEREPLGPAELIRERLLTGLRLCDGVDLDALAAEIGSDPLAGKRDELDELIELEMIEATAGRLRPTAEGLMFADALAERLSP